ncbi:hypothetical protein E8E14_014624 [Neopestalotiopsis sp. 37M]|nr:hypothetical protein E8E14_014624 [Neopestalotiopsis sp. 37M]
MNGHSTSTYDSPFASGWTNNTFFVDPGTYVYYNVTSQRDKEVPVSRPGEYSTDIVANQTLSYLESAIASGKPFFIGAAPIGPHAQVENGPNGFIFDKPVPANRHENKFPNIKAPRTPNFNPDMATAASWIKRLERLNETTVDYLDTFYRARIQTLQAVDEMVDTIITSLEKHPSVLENTYIFYTADNGFHLGQHRMAAGKTCAIEEDINVPFFVRGPGIEKNVTVNAPSSHTDIVPTVFQLAGIPLKTEFDGEPIPLRQSDNQQHARKSEHVNVEFWGTGFLEGDYIGSGAWLNGNLGSNNTYKSVRVISPAYDLSYTVWCTNEHELYDMKVDPYQMNNIYDGGTSIHGWSIARLVSRLDALLLTLKACKGKVCTRPWETLHPQDDVHNLADAMNARFDEFYIEKQAKVTFSACMLGYLPAYEGALEPLPYHGGETLLAPHWSDWT